MNIRTTKHIRIESSYYEELKQISKEIRIPMAVIIGEVVGRYTRAHRIQKAVEEAKNKVGIGIKGVQ